MGKLFVLRSRMSECCLDLPTRRWEFFQHNH
uniref:Uncharacterized protein n=1 Tax=Rhizophora mucronata TaxID=61149 RepID=A0A2P2Q0U4_RHIMU